LKIRDWEFRFRSQSFCWIGKVFDSTKTGETFLFLPLQERPLHEKRRSAEAEVAGMARYCKAIGDNLGNLPDFSLQKTKGSTSSWKSPLFSVSVLVFQWFRISVYHKPYVWLWIQETMAAGRACDLWCLSSVYQKRPESREAY
jgi:hypothetical protein